MASIINDILTRNYVDTVFHTHVSLIQPRGKFQFNRETLEEFWNAYLDIIPSNPVLGIAEKAQGDLPILIDIDLKIKDTDSVQLVNDKLYTESQVLDVIEVCQSIIRSIVENCTDNHLICVLLEKPLTIFTKNDISYIKNGFHLHFPYAFLSKANQEIHYIPRAKILAKQMEIFSNLGIEDSGSVIDKNCVKVEWLLYGSRKEEGSNPYLFSKVFDADRDEIDLETAFSSYPLYTAMEEPIDIEGNVLYYLPRILSIIPMGRPISTVKKGLISPLKEIIQEKTREKKTYEKESVERLLNEAKKLLPLLADWRAEDYYEWMTIGWVLYNISEGSSDGLDLWCTFSARCEDKYDEAVCIYNWERMVKRDYSIGTLKHFANLDNPDAYRNLKKDQADKHAKDSLGGSHADIAKVMYAEYGDEFVCASIRGKIWYQFINHHWEEIDDGYSLRNTISGPIAAKYADRCKDIWVKLNECNDKNEEALIQNKIKQYAKMIANLKSAPFKANVMKECLDIFYDKRFRDKLDNNPNLIGFKNGVYDLKANKFRPGRPEDFISTCMPINYIEFEEDDERINDVMTFIEKVFPDRSIRNYFLDTASDVFVGGNHEKIVLFWTGEGNNGKSVTQELFQKMLGRLAVKLSTTIVTGKKTAAGAANADLARTGNGIRMAVFEEPDGDESINNGTFKHLSGNDSFFARDLFERGKDSKEIIPMFKLIFICNKLPRMKYSDKATWDRVRVIPFESTFCRPDNPAPDTYEEQLRQKRFPMDKRLSQKIPDMIEAFAYILLQHRLKMTVRVEPEKVRIATNTYMRQNDIYRQFVEEIIVEDDTKAINLVELYNYFKDWFRDGFPNHSLPIKSEVEEYFERLWGSPSRGKKWKGYRVKTAKDDDEEEKEEEEDEDTIYLGDADLSKKILPSF